MVLKKSQVPRKVKNSFLELVEKGYLPHNQLPNAKKQRASIS